MSSYRLATRYAKSLIDLSREKGILDRVYNDLILIDKAFECSKDLTLFFRSPVITADKKLAVTNKLFKDKVSEAVYAFLTLLIRKGREGYIREMAESFIKQYNVINKITPVTFTSAVKLEPAMVQTIVNALKAKENLTTIELTEEVDESLIGGFVLRYDDKMLDNSVKRRLHEFRTVVHDDSYIKKY